MLRGDLLHGAAGHLDRAGGPLGLRQEHADRPRGRLLPPDAGQILVDGRDLATVRLADYRSQLGVVFQDNFLFDGTVFENIAYARPDASR